MCNALSPNNRSIDYNLESHRFGQSNHLRIRIARFGRIFHDESSDLDENKKAVSSHRP